MVLRPIKKAAPKKKRLQKGPTFSTLTSGELNVVLASLVLRLFSLGMNARTSNFGFNFEPVDGS